MKGSENGQQPCCVPSPATVGRAKEGRDRCSEMMTAESKHLLLLLLVCLFLNTTSRDPGEWTRRHSNMDLFGLMLAFLTFFFWHLESRQACSPLLCHSLIMSLGVRNRSRPALSSWSAMDFKIESAVTISAYCLGPLSDPSIEPGSLDSSSIDE